MKSNITQAQLKQAEDFFTSTPDTILAGIASEMNRTLPFISPNIMELEKRRILNEEVDELMLIIITIWYVYTKLIKVKIKTFNNKAMEKNTKIFSDMIKYFNNEPDKDALSKIQYFKDPLLASYLAKRIDAYFKKMEDIPLEALAMLFSLVKCIEDGLPG